MDGLPAEKETFALYYAKYLIAHKGYQPGVVPEAEELARACDYVLTKADGVSFAIAAIVDREAHPEKVFTLSTYQVEAIAKACLQYSGRVNRAQMPVAVSIYEIGPGATNEESARRLAPYKREGLFSKAFSVAWTLDSTSHQVWTNLPFIAALFQKRAAEKILKAPRLDGADLVAPVRAIASDPGRPYFTYGLLALLCVLFACEQIFRLDPTSGLLAPSIRTLVALGGLSYGMVAEFGQWWRIFTAPLMHGDLTHLLFNGLSLFLIGRLLEPLIGWRWSAAAFAISALCGSLMSLAINPANIVGIGASGGIVGLFATALVVSFRIPLGALRTRLQTGAIYSLLPALIPFANAATSGAKIDYGAHFGGALGGAAMGLALLALWPGDRERPRWAVAGAVVAALFFAVAAGSLVPITQDYRLQQSLAPDFPDDSATQQARADELVQKYPRDPRARLVHAFKFLAVDDMAGAQADLRAGLAEQELLRSALDPSVETRIRSLLAAILADDGKADEAKAIAKPACGRETVGPFANLLTSRRLCP